MLTYIKQKNYSQAKFGLAVGSSDVDNIFAELPKIVYLQLSLYHRAFRITIKAKKHVQLLGCVSFCRPSGEMALGGALSAAVTLAGRSNNK